MESVFMQLKSSLTLICLTPIRGALLAVVCGLLLSTSAQAGYFRMFVGEIQTLQAGDIERVAVGSGGLISTSILKDGNVLVLAEGAGETELRIWLKDGSIQEHRFLITEANSVRSASEIRTILKNVAGLQVVQVGTNVILKGSISHRDAGNVKKVVASYSNIIDLTSATASTDLGDVFKDIEGLKIRKAGEKIIVSGEVTTADKEYIVAVQGAFPEIVDITKTPAVAMKEMVYMNVQITEFSTNALENLGIQWDTSFNGFSAGFARNFISEGNLSVFDNNTSDLVLPNQVAGNLTGFFGIATRISSQINLSVQTGDALILASPNLSTRSGSEAEFLAGGEFPIPVPSGNGDIAIEFKQFGIKLKIKPEVAANGTVVADVETELSAIDQSVSVNGTPGLRSRQTKTQVSMQQGQTLAISGLVNKEFGHDINKFKWLGDIPILGRLFRSNNFRNNRSDLVIFITPQVFDANSEENKKRIQIAHELEESFLSKVRDATEIID